MSSPDAQSIGKKKKFDRNKFEIQRFVSGYDHTTEA